MNNILLAGGLGFLGSSVMVSMFADRALKHPTTVFNSDTRLFETTIGSSTDKRSVIDDMYVVDNKSNDKNPYMYLSNHLTERLDAQSFLNRMREMDHSTSSNIFFSQVHIEDRDISDVDDMAEFIREKNIVTIINTAGKFIQQDFTLPESYYDDAITWPALALLEAALRNNQVVRFVQPVFSTAMNLKLNIPGLPLHPFIKSQQKMKEYMEAMVENSSTNAVFLDLVFVAIPMVDMGCNGTNYMAAIQIGALSGHPWYGDMLNLLPLDYINLSDNGDAIIRTSFSAREGMLPVISNKEVAEYQNKSKNDTINTLLNAGIQVKIPVMTPHQFFTRDVAGNILARAGWFFIQNLRSVNKGEDAYFYKWIERDCYGTVRSVGPKIKIFNVSICSFEHSKSSARYRYVSTDSMFKDIFSEYSAVIDYVPLDAACGLPVITSQYQYILKGTVHDLQKSYITKDNLRDIRTADPVSVLYGYSNAARLNYAESDNGEIQSDILSYQSIKWRAGNMLPKLNANYIEATGE